MKNKLVEEFLSNKKEEYPEELYSQLNEVCRYPFKYIRKMMSRDDIPDIRIQYFGIFKPLKKRLKGVLMQLEQRKENMDKKEYEKMTTILKKRLDENC